MAKGSRKGEDRLQPDSAVPVHLDPSVETELREVAESKELWSEFTLDDGTIVRVRPTVLEAKKAKGRYNREGDPVYLIKTGIMIHTRIPPELRRGATESAEDDEEG